MMGIDQREAKKRSQTNALLIEKKNRPKPGARLNAAHAY
jgi:hypothetical protein